MTTTNLQPTTQSFLKEGVLDVIIVTYTFSFLIPNEQSYLHLGNMDLHNFAFKRSAHKKNLTRNITK